MSSRGYKQVLKDNLLPFIKQHKKENLVLQQDNSKVYVNKSTITWLEKNEIDVLPWPSQSPDLNPMENLWGAIVRDVYREGKKYNNTDDLKKAILESWESISAETIKALSGSMYGRIFKIGVKKGRLTSC